MEEEKIIMSNLAKCLIAGLISGFLTQIIIGLLNISPFLLSLSFVLSFIGAFIVAFIGLIGGLIYFFVRKIIKVKYSEFYKGLLFGFIFFLLFGIFSISNILTFLNTLIESFLFGLIFGGLMKKFGFQEYTDGQKKSPYYYFADLVLVICFIVIFIIFIFYITRTKPEEIELNSYNCLPNVSGVYSPSVYDTFPRNIIVYIRNAGKMNISSSEITIMVDGQNKTSDFNFSSSTIMPQDSMGCISETGYSKGTNHTVVVISPSNDIKIEVNC